MINPIKINDIEIGKFLIIILAAQAAMFGVIGLRLIGLDVPFLSQTVGFIYLTFIPGIVILRIMRLHNLSTTETLIYSVGLSVAFSMFIGFLINTTSSVIGISKPISILPLIITMGSAVLILSVLSYVRDRGFSSPSFIDVKELISPPALFLLLLVLIAILGAFLVTFYASNYLLLLLVILIAFIAGLVVFNRFIPAKLYPLAVGAITLALLYHRTLISSYLIGWDIHVEYYFAQLVALNSHWDWTIPHNYNAMLSDTILPTIYSSVMNIDVAWIYKIVYSLLFLLVPLTLYQLYQKQTDKRTAFFAVFFFMSLPAAINIVGLSIKQLIASVFLALLILLMIDKRLDRTKRAILTTVYSFCLVVSHYGTSYIYMFYIILAWLLLYLTSYRAKNVRQFSLSGTSVVLFAVMALAWYMYISSSASFDAVVNIGNHIYTNLGEILNLATRDPSLLRLIGMKETLSPLHEVSKHVYRASQLLIVVGVVELLISQLKRRATKFEPEYVATVFLSLVLILLCLILPLFSQVMHMDRVYIIALLFLSPFCILGWQAIWGWGSRLFRLTSTSMAAGSRIWMKLLVFVVLIPYFLFNIGFFYEVTGDYAPTSIPLSLERMIKTDNKLVIVAFNSEYIFEEEVFSARWLSKNKGDGSDVYSDAPSRYYILPSYGNVQYAIPLHNTTYYLHNNSYIYLSRLNVVDGIMHSYVPKAEFWAYYNFSPAEISQFLRNKIYSNSGSEIYYYQ